MDPRVAWISFDAGDYIGAATGFSKADCASPEKMKYEFLAGVAWKRAGWLDLARSYFGSATQRYLEGIEPRSRIDLRPLAFAEFADISAASGDWLAITDMRQSYGVSFDIDRVTWLDDDMPALETTSIDAASRDFRALDAETPLSAYVTYQLARALKTHGSVDEARTLLEASMDAIVGTFVVHGEKRDLRTAAEDLLGGGGSETWELLFGGDRRIWMLVAAVWLVVLVAMARRRRSSFNRDDLDRRDE